MGQAAALAERLGLGVRDLDLLGQALTHSSYLYEHPEFAAGHNERLEYLGDSVVNLAVSDALFRRHPGGDEGVLSVRRAAIVSAVGLSRLARRIDLGDYLLLGEGEARSGGRLRPALLASAFEALVGALYLDLGFERASAFVTGLAAAEITGDRPLGVLKGPKARLQEYTQRLSGERPRYLLLDAAGPDHAKVFRVDVEIGGQVIATGEGHSRRLAETAAATQAIETLRVGTEGASAQDVSELAGFAAGASEVGDGSSDERPQR